MTSLDLSFSTPAENLACDEALLNWAEDHGGDEVLRFWESPVPFVVVGYANKIETEVNVPACNQRNIPVHRRSSGGGTVVQGPGCLNYAVVLRITDDGPTRNISTANQFVMEKNREAIALALSTINHPLSTSTISIRGHTDLALGDKKFSGNAQRRRRHFLLFHGTFLLNCDLDLISEVLRMPSLQPDYRQKRNHGDFVMNLNVPSEAVKSAMTQIWKSGESLKEPRLDEIPLLVQQRYGNHEWNFKF